MMLAIFWRQLKKNGIMIMGWGLGLGILGFYLFDIYETIFVANANVADFIGAFPEELMAFFGQQGGLITPTSFLSLEFFSYMPLILGIMVVSAASGLVARREEDGTLELVIAQPISRSRVFWGKLLALLVSLVLILGLTWSGFAIGMGQGGTFDFSLWQMSRAFISLFAVLLVFQSLALLLSMVLPSSTTAGLVSGFLVVVFYFVSSLSNIDENLEGINRFSPMKYYQGGEAIEQFELNNLLILLAVAIVLILLSWIVFERRDLRFGGSGGFRMRFGRKPKVENPD
ncbi:MAG: ABC transporter permease subunit [Acidobacteriota bacterium]